MLDDSKEIWIHILYEEGRMWCGVVVADNILYEAPDSLHLAVVLDNKIDAPICKLCLKRFENYNLDASRKLKPVT